MLQHTREVEVRMGVNDLKVGMYVCRLDRPWNGSPFSNPGVWIQGTEELAQIRDCCQHVFVDWRRTLDATPLEHIDRVPSPPESGHGEPPANPAMARSERQVHEWASATTGNASTALRKYRDQCTVAQELAHARVALLRLEAAIAGVLDACRDDKTTVDVRPIQGAVKTVAASVRRQPDAVIGLAIGRNDRPYTLRHCVNMSVWSLVLGRQMGLPATDLILLGTGAALCDIGRARLPVGLLQRPSSLARWELDVVREHVALGADLIVNRTNLDPVFLTMIVQHHERLDGTGYPANLAGMQIDLYARIAAIADCFDAMLANAAHSSAMPISATIKELRRLRASHLQKELVDTFIAAIGIYPAGSVVELNSGEVGVVIEVARNHLRPNLLLYLDQNRRPLQRKIHFDLADATAQRCHITRDHPQGACAVHAGDYFHLSGDMHSVRQSGHV